MWVTGLLNIIATFLHLIEKYRCLRLKTNELWTIIKDHAIKYLSYLKNETMKP